MSLEDKINDYLEEEKTEIHEGTNALHIAADYSDTEAIKYLLEKRGYDVNAANKYGYTALHVATSSSDMTAPVEALLEAGANTELYSTEIGTPLHIAAQRGRLKVTKLLLKSGANTSARNAHNATPLEVAEANYELNYHEGDTAGGQAYLSIISMLKAAKLNEKEEPRATDPSGSFQFQEHDQEYEQGKELEKKVARFFQFGAWIVVAAIVGYIVYGVIRFGIN